MEETSLEPKKSGNGKTVAIILLLLLLIGSGIGNFFLFNKEQNSTALVSSKIDSINAYHSLKDSLITALEEEEQKVAGLREEIIMYQNDNDSLKQLLDEKIAKIASLRSMINNGGSPGKLRALKDSLNIMSAQNMAFKSQVDTLLYQNEDYLAKLQERENQINALESQKKTLNDKVNIAAQPSVGPVIVTPMYQKKGIYIPVYKAKKIERLLITFDVLGNKLTDKAVKREYVVRVIDPDGIVLSNNNNQLSNSDDVYTAKEQVTFNGTQQKIKINYTQKPSYKKGAYKVELKEGSEVKQNFSFELM
jgi:flagellar basal body-associated protein FliL